MNLADTRFPRLGKLSVAAVTASLAMSAALASGAAADGPGYGTPTIVTVGDSLASGEAGRWAGNTNWDSVNTDRLGVYAYGESFHESIPGCHRSKVAQNGIGGGVISKNLACSGAKTTSYYTTDGQYKPGLDHPTMFVDPKGRTSQTQELQHYAATRNVKAVVVTIGANNYGFGEIIARCVWNFAHSPWWAKNLCSDDSDMTVRFTAEARRTRTDQVTAALKHVGIAMENAGYNPSQYAIIARTYWSPIPRGGQFRYDEAGYGRQATGGCGFWDADANWANDVVVGALNDTLKNAAATSGLPNIKIVDQERMLDGRRLCGYGVGLLEEQNLSSWRSTNAVDRSEWVAQIRSASTLAPDSPYEAQESAHANYWGQMAMRNCLRQAYNGGLARGGSCVRVANGLNASGEPQMALR